MNGTSRLYRSTSEAMLGGVAAGLGNYFKVDPTIVRAAFVILTFITGGAFALVYVAMWLLVPTAGSTSTSPGEVMQENLSDIGSRVRNFTGGYSSNVGNGPATTPTNGSPNINGGNGGNGGNGSNGAPNGTNIAPFQSGATHRMGIGPLFLIGLGLFFLFANTGIFHVIRWGFWWPVLLIGLGAFMLMRRNR